MPGSMRFKNYIWPHNPRCFEIEYERRISCIKLPFAGHVVQDLGACAKVFSGEGEFCGESAYSDFKELAEVFSQGGVGTLIHPLWPPVNAVFEKLSLVEEPLCDYVRYTFRFVEYSDGTQRQSATANTSTASQSSYTVRSGQSLGEIAESIGMSTSEIMKLNPDIKNPNVLSVGQIIRTE